MILPIPDVSDPLQVTVYSVLVCIARKIVSARATYLGKSRGVRKRRYHNVRISQQRVSCTSKTLEVYLVSITDS